MPTSSAFVFSIAGLVERAAQRVGLQRELFDLDASSLSPRIIWTVSPAVLAMFRQGGEEILARATNAAEVTGVPCESVLRDALTRRVCDLVVGEAKQWGAQLIVIGSHGRRGAGCLLMGSDAEQIARLSPVPVLLVRATA